MPDLRSGTLASTSSLVVRSVDCHGDMDGLCKLLKQSLKLPVELIHTFFLSPEDPCFLFQMFAIIFTYLHIFYPDSFLHI